MKIAIAALVLSALIVGCNQSEAFKPNAPLPQGLKDCKFYNIWQSGSLLRVVRCPNSSTTTNYQSGKTNTSVTVVEG